MKSHLFSAKSWELSADTGCLAGFVRRLAGSAISHCCKGTPDRISATKDWQGAAISIANLVLLYYFWFSLGRLNRAALGHSERML
jgi:hypothetical protein